MTENKKYIHYCKTKTISNPNKYDENHRLFYNY